MPQQFQQVLEKVGLKRQPTKEEQEALLLKEGKKPGLLPTSPASLDETLPKDDPLRKAIEAMKPRLARTGELLAGGLDLETAKSARSVTEGRMKIPYTPENVLNTTFASLRGAARDIVKSYLISQMVHKETGRKISPVEPQANVRDFRITQEAIDKAQEMLGKKDLSEALKTLGGFQYERALRSRAKAVEEIEDKKLDKEFIGSTGDARQEAIAKIDQSKDKVSRETMVLYDSMRDYGDMTAEEIANDPKRANFRRETNLFLVSPRQQALKGLDLVGARGFAGLDRDMSRARIASKFLNDVMFDDFKELVTGQEKLLTSDTVPMARAKHVLEVLAKDRELAKKVDAELNKQTAEYNRRLRENAKIDGAVDPREVVLHSFGIDVADYAMAKQWEKLSGFKKETFRSMEPTSTAIGMTGRRSDHSTLLAQISKKYGVPFQLKDEWTIDEQALDEWVEQQIIQLGPQAADGIMQKVAAGKEEFDKKRSNAPYEIPSSKGGRHSTESIDSLLRYYGLPPMEAEDARFEDVWRKERQEIAKGGPRGISSLMRPLKSYEESYKIDLPRPLSDADLEQAGVRGWERAIIKGNPAITTEHFGEFLSTAAMFGGAVVQPWRTLVESQGVAIDDLSEGRRAFIGAMDAVTQIAAGFALPGVRGAGGIAKGATGLETARNALSFGAKIVPQLLKSEAMIDALESLPVIDQYGFDEGSTMIVEGILSQFNPLTFFDPEATLEDKAIAGVSQTFALLGGGLTIYAKVKDAKAKGYTSPFFDAEMSEVSQMASQMQPEYRAQALRIYQEIVAGVSAGVTDPATLKNIQEFALRTGYGAADSVAHTANSVQEGVTELGATTFDAEAYRGEKGIIKHLQDAYNNAKGQWTNGEWGGSAANPVVGEGLRAFAPKVVSEPLDVDLSAVSEQNAQEATQEGEGVTEGQETAELADVESVEDALNRLKSGEPITVNLDELDNELAKDLAELADAPGIDVAANEDGTWTFTFKEALTPDQIPDTIETKAKDEVKATPLSLGTEYTTTLDPADIQVDPGVQFKEVTDTKSMTGEALKDVDVFDIDTAGELLVWEKNDGTFVVIHGHHRLDLANRATKFVRKGPSGPIDVDRKVRVSIRREADGWTLQKVRQLGALENLQAGTAKPLETVKALRELELTPDDMRGMGISLKGALARDVAGLLTLPDEAFNHIGPGKLSEQAAAGIGSVTALTTPEMRMGAVSEALEAEIGRTFSDGRRFGEIFAFNAESDFKVGDQGTLPDMPEKVRSSIKEQAGLRERVENRIIKEAREYKSGVGLKTLEGEKIDVEQRKALLDAMGGSAKAAEDKLALLFERDAPIQARLKSLGGEIASGAKTLEEASAEFYSDVLEGIARPVKDLVAGRAGDQGRVSGEAPSQGGSGAGETVAPPKGDEGGSSGALFGEDEVEVDRSYGRQKFVDELFKGIPDEQIDGGLPAEIPPTAVFESVLSKYEMTPEAVADVKETLGAWRKLAKSPASKARINEYQRSLEKTTLEDGSVRYERPGQTNAVQEEPDQSVLREGEVPGEGSGVQEDGQKPEGAQEEVSLADTLAGKIEDVDAEIARLKKELGEQGPRGGVGMGLGGADPVLFAKSVKLGALYAKKVALHSAEWATAMVESVGEWVKPHLDAIRRILESANPDVAMEFYMSRPEPGERPSTGLSNQVQSKEAILGILGADPRTKGMTQEQLLNLGKDAFAEDPDLDFESLAKNVANGTEPFDPRTVSILYEGKERLIEQADRIRESLGKAIESDASAAEIATLKNNLDDVRTRLDEYVKNVQVGKGKWSDTGRALQLGVELDVTNPEAVLQAARESAGAKLSPKAEEELIGLATDAGRLKTLLDHAEPVRKLVRDLIADALDPEKKLPGINPVLKDGKVDYDAVHKVVSERYPDLSAADIDAILSGKVRKPSRTPEAKQIEFLKIQAEARLRDLLHQLETGEFDAPKQKKVYDAELEAIRAAARKAAQEVKKAIRALEPRTFFRALDDIGRNVQLFNPYARFADLMSNLNMFLGTTFVENPLRSGIASILAKGTPGRERPFWTPGKMRRAFENYRQRAGQDIEEAWSGRSQEAIEKFGPPTGISTRAAGATDAPFKTPYKAMAYDDWVRDWANQTGGDHDAAMRQLLTGEKGPLSRAEVRVAEDMAEEWYLLNTYNIENWASATTTGMKTWANKIERESPGSRVHRETADAIRFVYNVPFRFAKVIGNVALSAARYHPTFAASEASARYVRARARAMGGPIDATDARLISDILAKGMIGTGVYYLGQAVFGAISDEDKTEDGIDLGWIRGEVVTTESGNRFIEWRILPTWHGGMDASQLPGLWKSFERGLSRGMIQEMVEDGRLTEDQGEQLLTDYERQQAFAQPLVTAPRDISEAILGERSITEFIGARIASQAVPGWLNEEAQRLDEARNDVQLRKPGKDATDAERIWAPFQKRLPSPPENSFLDGLRQYTREGLDPNVKRVSPFAYNQGESRIERLGKDADENIKAVYDTTRYYNIPTNPLEKAADAYLDAEPEAKAAKLTALKDLASRLRRQADFIEKELGGDVDAQRIAIRLSWAPQAGKMTTESWEAIDRMLERRDIPKSEWPEIKKRAAAAVQKARAATGG